jgi:hypothetical protein
MKRLNVRLPAALLAEIEAEARVRKISKAHVVRERLSKAFAGLPSDLSSRQEMYLTPSDPQRR